ncbi:MAG: hypothetical protein ACOYOE_11990 [Chlorobium sp.]
MAGKITTLKNSSGVITGYSYSNNYTDVGGTHNATTLYDTSWRVISSSLTTTKGSTTTSSTWKTITTSGVVTHQETGYLTDGIITSNWEYNFDALWKLTSKTFSQSADITKITQVVIDGVTGYETTDAEGVTSHYDSTGLLTYFRIPYTDGTDAANIKTGARTYDTDWHPVLDTWTNSKDGSIVNQTTNTDSQGIVTYLQKGHNSTGTSTWEYHFDATWHLLDGYAVDGVLITTFGPNWNVISQLGDMTDMTKYHEVSINTILYLATTATSIDTDGTEKVVETLYNAATGALYGYRVNNDQITGGKSFPGTLTFDPTWKLILNKTWTVSEKTANNNVGDVVSEDNFTTNGNVTHVQKGHSSTGASTWEFHFSETVAADGKPIWTLTEGWSNDGLITTTFGKNFTIISQLADTSKLTLLEDGSYSMQENDSTYSFFDAKGAPTGHRTVSTTVDDNGILSTTTSNFGTKTNADGTWKIVDSSWSRSDGTTGTTDYTTTNGRGKVIITEYGRKADDTGASNWVYHFSTDWEFLGGTFHDGVANATKAFGPDWLPMTALKNDTTHPDLVTGYEWTDPNPITNPKHTTTFYDLAAFNETGYSQPYAATEISGTTTAGTRTYDAYWTQVLDTKQVTELNGNTYSQISHYASDGKTVTEIEQVGTTSANTSTHTSTFDYHFNASYNMVSGIQVEGVVTTILGSGGRVISRQTDTTLMTALKDINNSVFEYQKTDTVKDVTETIHSGSTGALIGYSLITGTTTDTNNGNITIKETNYASDHTTITGYEQISHNSTGTSYWDIVLDAKGLYDGKWLDDGLTTKAFDEYDVQIGLILDAGRQPDAVHLEALKLIGVAALAHDQVA